MFKLAVIHPIRIYTSVLRPDNIYMDDHFIGEFGWPKGKLINSAPEGEGCEDSKF